MKSGFKPKLFTKKEWQDNRDPALKASGVGAALDLWQRHCPKAVGALDEAGCSQAMKVCLTLLVALKKAEDKCKTPALENDKKGIGEYRKIVQKYQSHLKLATDGVGKLRRTMFDRITKNLTSVYEAITKDARLKEIAAAAAKKALCPKEFDAWLLWKSKKYAAAVASYGKNNDYNMPDSANRVLVAALIDKRITPEVQEKFKEAIETVATELDGLMGGGVFSGTTQGEPFRAALKDYLAAKYTVPDFKMA